MAICKQVNDKLVELDNKLTTKISEGVKVTSSGESLLRTQDVVKLAMEAEDTEVAKKLLAERIATTDFMKAIVARTSEVVNVAIRSGDAREFSKNKNDQVEMTIIRVTPVDKYVVFTLANPKGEYYTYRFDNGNNSDVSYKSDANGTSIKIVGIGSAITDAERYSNNVMHTFSKTAAKRQGDRLRAMRESLDTIGQVIQTDVGSSDVGSVNLDDYIKDDAYENGNLSSVKRTLDKLHQLDYYKVSDEYVEHIKGIIDAFHPYVMRDIALVVQEKADDNTGWVSYDNKLMGVTVARQNTPSKIHQSAVEVLGHEYVHTGIDFAINSNSRETNSIVRRVNYLRQEVFTRTKWQDFLVVPTQNGIPMNPTAEDTRRAKEIYNYIFTGKNSVKEFMTYGLTNPAVMKHLKGIILKDRKTTAFEKLKEFFNTLLDVALGKYSFREENKNAFDRAMSLAMELAEINNRAEATAITLDVTGSIANWIDNREREFVDFIDEWTDKFMPQEDRPAKLSPNAGPVETGIFVAQFVFKALTMPAYAKAVAQLATKFGMPAESSLREAIADVLDESEARKNANWLGLFTNRMDGIRESIAGMVGEVIYKGMKRPMSKAQEVAITEVLLDTNASVLFYGNNKLSTNKIVEILTNNSSLAREIKRTEDGIKRLLGADKSRANWTVAQAHGLGYLMATHLGNTAQNTNSLGIVRGVRYDKRFNDNTNLLRLVQVLSSLQALKYTDSLMKTQVSELLVNEYTGVKNIMNVYESFKTISKGLFRDDPLHMMDGYTKEVIDNTIDIVYAPMSEATDLLNKGYEFKFEVKGKAGLVNRVATGVFVSPKYAVAERQRGALPLEHTEAKGASLKEKNFKEDPINGFSNFIRDSNIIAKYNKRLLENMKNGVFNPTTVDTGIMATLNAQGFVTDYRYTMSKQMKKELLSMDKSVVKTLARSMSAVSYKAMKEQHEIRVLNEITRVMGAEWKEGEVGTDTLTEFTLIGPEVDNPKHKELFNMLPYNFREYINSRADKVMAVPSELMNIYFGYKHLQFSDFPGIKHLPEAIKTILDTLEKWWMDLVKIAKETILLKIPSVLIFNIISNFMFMLTKCFCPLELAKMHVDSFRDVQDYFKDEKTKTRLIVEINALAEELDGAIDIESIKEKLYKKQTELQLLEERLVKNPIKELGDLGMSQAIVDDVNMSEVEKGNIIKDRLDSLLTYVPTVVKTPLQWMYLSKETTWYKTSRNILQASDLVARDIMNRREKLMEEKQANGEAKLPREYLDAIKEKYGRELPDQVVLEGKNRAEFFEIMKGARHYKLLRWFINYTQPNGKLEEYANKVGLLMFTKYVKRIQRTIFSSMKEHPLKSMGALLLGHFMLNVDTIYDQSYTTKGFDNEGHWSIFNIFPMYSPIDIIETVVNPPLIAMAKEYA